MGFPVFRVRNTFAGMINFVPIFPLEIVVFPGEQLNLHIFEERYKQLIAECIAEKKPFGIPTVLKNNVAEMGTVVEITEVAAVHPDGKIDIRTEGTRVFRILEVIKNIPDKLYSGAIVEYPDNIDAAHLRIMPRVIGSLRELHKLLKVNKDFKKPDEALRSYDIAHHAGLSLEEEYELLGLFREDQRLEYLKRHLKKVLPAVLGAELLKERVQLNGHFKELKGFDLNF